MQQCTNGCGSVCPWASETSQGQVSQKPSHDSGLSCKAALFYGCHLVRLPFWQTTQNHTNSWTTPRVSSACLFFLSHTQWPQKLHTHTRTCVRRPVFQWGLIDRKMKTGACARQALLIIKRHRVYYSGPASDPNTSPRQPASLHY